MPSLTAPSSATFKTSQPAARKPWRHLILPDLHLKWHVADQIIDHEKPDEVWLLGDYFDGENDSVEQTAQMCRWLLANPDYKKILGNHDVHYLSPNEKYRCGGFSEDKCQVVCRYFTEEAVRRHFMLYGRSNGFLLTHAGVSGRLLNELSLVPVCIYSELDAAFLGLFEVSGKNAFLASMVNTGYWEEFVPVTGLAQIFGHTQDVNIRGAFLRGGQIQHTYSASVMSASSASECSLCIDTGLAHYAVIEEPGKVQVKSTPKRFLASYKKARA